MISKSILFGLATVCASLATAQTGYVTHQVIDTNGNGGLAMTYNIPRGWSARDNIVWNLNLRMNPMCSALQVASPDHSTWFSYTSGLTFDFLYRGGQLAAGKAPPRRASDFLVEDVQATLRNVPYQIVAQQDTPIPFPGNSVPGVVKNAVHSTLTVRFQVGQTPMEQNLSMDFYGYMQPIGGGAYKGNWFVSGLAVVNSPESGMQNAEQVAANVVGSERMSKEFADRYQQVCKMLLDKTKAETEELKRQRAHQIVVRRYSGGGGGHVMNKDEFIMHEELRGLRSHLFSYAIGN